MDNSDVLFDKISKYKKYIPDYDEGDTLATQAATATLKVVYRRFNDGDFIGILSGPGSEVLDSYVSWLATHIMETKDAIDALISSRTEDEYDENLEVLVDEVFNDITLDKYSKMPKEDSIYENEELIYYDDDGDYNPYEDYDDYED